MSDVIRKIDPRLRRGTAGFGLTTMPAAEAGTVRVFIEVNNASGLAWLRSHPGVKKLVQIVDGYCTATVNIADLPALQAHPDVLEVEGGRHVRSHLDHSVVSIQGWEDLPTPNERQVQGSGVVIGIVDYGLDFRLADFCEAGDSKRSRIEFLWDQELQPQGAEKSPDTYGYGVEYTREHIDAALRAPDPSAVVRHKPLNREANISGHGTHVAGIAAGNGQTADGTFYGGKYLGVAPGATLVFVHLARQTIVDQVNSATGTLANSVDLAHAVAYCFEKADKLNMPCVVNLSMGFNGGGHDGNMAVEVIIDQLLAKAGRAVVIAAGNEHAPHKQVHYGAWLPRNGSREILWDTGFLQIDPNGEFPWGDPTANEVEIWYSNRSRIAVQLVAPDGEETEWINPGNDSAAHRFAGGEEVIISSDPQTAWDGAACIYLRLNPGGERNWIRCGTWTIGLRALAVGDSEPDKGVRFDAWIERTIPDPGEDDRELWSRFVDYDRNAAITLTTPSTARRAITVASCDSNEMPKISDFSSRGKTRDERYKPEIAAPGKSVFSTNAGAGSGEPPAPARKEMYGTSMAAPHIAGVVARLLARQHYLTWEEIRDLLVRSAVLPAGVLPAGVEPPWEGQWGYGRVNAARAMQLLEARLR